MSEKSGESTVERLEAKASDALTAERVADYLRRHPDFFVRYPDILKDMMPPARWKGDTVVDLQQFMLLRMREEMTTLRDCAIELIETSRSNMSSQTRTLAAVLALLGAGDLEGLVQIIRDDLPLILDVDVATIGFEPAGRPLAGLSHPDICRLQDGFVDALVGAERNVNLIEDMLDDGTIFGAGAGLVRSAALARLPSIDGVPTGLLALGSRDPASFHPTQGSELVEFLGRVVEPCVHKWLADSA